MSSNGSCCPLCLETMDSKDVSFYPCPCLYQICVFCWTKIIKEENGLCPACRKPYDSESPNMFVQKTVVDGENKRKPSKRKKDVPNRRQICKETLKLLPELRVIQTNLVFVVGLPQWIAKEKDVLKGPTYFGQFGKVFKVEVNSNQTFTGPQGQPSVSAYITYCRAVDAMRAVLSFDQSSMRDRQLRVSLGTTKYCSQFLKGHKCNKHECMYLHELGDPKASFTKEQMQAGKHTEYMNELLNSYMSQLSEEKPEQSASLCSAEKLSLREHQSNDVQSRVLFPTNSSSTSVHPRRIDGTSNRRVCNNSKFEGVEPHFDSLPDDQAGDLNVREASFSLQRAFHPVRKNFCRKPDSDGSIRFPLNSVQMPSQSQDKCWVGGSVFLTQNDSRNHLSAKNFSSLQSRHPQICGYKDCDSASNSNLFSSSPPENPTDCDFSTEGNFDKKEFSPAVRRGSLSESTANEVDPRSFTQPGLSKNSRAKFVDGEEQPADIDFDPIRESQQGLAELMAAEKNDYSSPSVSHSASFANMPVKDLGSLGHFQNFSGLPNNCQSQDTSRSRVSLSTQTPCFAPPPGFEDFHSDNCIETPTFLPPYSFNEVADQVNNTSPFPSSLLSSVDANSAAFSHMLETICNQIQCLATSGQQVFVSKPQNYDSRQFTFDNRPTTTMESFPDLRKYQQLISNQEAGGGNERANDFRNEEHQAETLKEIYRLFLQSGRFPPLLNCHQSQDRNYFVSYSEPTQLDNQIMSSSRNFHTETLLNGYSSTDSTISNPLKFSPDVNSNSSVSRIQNTSQAEHSDFWLPSSLNHIALHQAGFRDDNKVSHVDEPPLIFQHESVDPSTSTATYRNFVCESSFNQNFSDFPLSRPYTVLHSHQPQPPQPDLT